MKRSFWVITLLISLLFWGVNATAIAQDQIIKDKKVQEVKKGDIKKQEMIKKADTKKEEMVKKGDVKKEEMIKKGDVKKQEMIKKSDTKKEEMMKKGEVKKEEMKKDVKGVKTTIKDKEVGKTADGKAIYEGPRGGKYTLSDKGTKVYIKKEVKKDVK